MFSLIIFAGMPAYNDCVLSSDLFMSEFAPIILPFEILDPLRIVDRHPIHTFSPMDMQDSKFINSPELLNILWKSVSIIKISQESKQLLPNVISLKHTMVDSAVIVKLSPNIKFPAFPTEILEP
jgi:hypothetical protein